MAVFGDLLQTYRTDELVVEARWVTWDLAVFAVDADDATAVVAVPRRDLDSFLADLWAGQLDQRLATEVRSPRVQRRRLASGDDASTVEVYGGVDDPRRLAPRERNVRTGRLQPPGGPGGRGAKRESSSLQPPSATRRLPTRLIVAVSIIAVLVLIGAALALSGGDDDVATTSSGAPASSDAGTNGSATGGSGAIDLTGVDACTLLDDATVASLTDVSERFSSQSSNLDRTCFWAVPKPGVGEYVELRLQNQPSPSGATFSPGPGCDAAPSSAAGDEAALVTCAGTSNAPQPKVELRAFERGVLVSVLVNDASPTEAELGAAVTAVFAALS